MSDETSDGYQFTLCRQNTLKNEKIYGEYEGWYYAIQGQTGLPLTINEDGSGIFKFYNMPGRLNAENGSYEVNVINRQNNRFSVEGVKWM